MKLPKPILDLVDLINAGPQGKHHGVMGVFYYVDDATEAVRALRASGLRDVRVYSPVPYHDIERALDQGPSIVRWVTLGGALCGITGGFALCIYSVLSWPLVVGGKELVSLPPFVVIGYESMILLGSLANLLGMLALTRLPEVRSSAPHDPRFTEDRIGIWVPCTGETATKVEAMMRGHRAEEVTLHA
jgi:molybdopterin-containing oxidoreductase family membrane subunit